MPIKPFKGFARRRSSGNVLESPETPADQQSSSFRVLERPAPTHIHSFGADPSTKPSVAASASAAGSSLARPRSSPMQHEVERRSMAATNGSPGYLYPDKDHTARGLPGPSARGSAQTFQSQSTNNNTSRDSYASTEPSSVESLSPEQVRPPPANHAGPAAAAAAALPVQSQDPAPKQAFSLKNAARTFSFAKAKKADHAQSPSPDRDSQQQPSQTRERTMTESSYSSTVVPPKLDLGTDLEFSSGFGDMFAAKRKSTIWEEGSAAAPRTDRSSFEKPPLMAANSWESNGPEDRLMSAAEHTARQKSAAQHDGGGLFTDTDALMVMNAVSSGRFLNEPASDKKPPATRSNPSPYDARSSPYSSALPQSGSIASQFARSTARAPAGSSMFAGRASLSADAERSAGADPDADPLFDPSKSARLAQLNSRRPMHKKPQPSKVMTPAEFDEYKRQKAVRPTDGDGDDKSHSSDSEVNYDDEDDAERDRSATKQRRRQEAQLAVYRQQMMKVTGEQPSALPMRPGLERVSRSTPNLLANRSSISLDPRLQKGRISDEEDDDDEIPLGILQAHGFPYKGKPLPGRPGPNGMRPATTLSSYPSPSGATRNDAATGGGGTPGPSSMPPFARNLPNDPYIGASLVSHTPRESMAMGGGAPPQLNSMPPGGLVGVIAGEERARAARRGSPNSRGVYDVVPTPQPTGFTPPQMPMPMTTPGEHAQMQTASQMQQMMQMQMQWMQQMMQMQGVQMPMPPFATAPDQRPASSGSQHRRVSSQVPFNGLGPNMPGMGQLHVPGYSQSVYGMPAPSNGYAPSIAPSERSNIGQPSRYRPVSSIHVDQSRTSSMSHHNRSASRLTMTDINGNTRQTVRAVEKPKKPVHVSDDEDEEGWAEMKKKKQERQSRWRRQKPSLTEQAGQGREGLEGLYYEA